MAAYAALVSLMHIIEQIQHHPRPPISIDKLLVESLTEKVTFLQDFLEGYSINGGSEDGDGLESRIADAAYAAEDVIESHIVNRIQVGSTSTDHGENISGSTEFYQGLQKVIKDMDFIKKELVEIKETLAGIQDQLLHRNSMSAGSSRSPPMVQNMTMVGFDDVLIEIMDKLTGQQSNRQIIPIVGMGGIGKTTLARNIYVNPLIKHHFDILAWATISQEYNAKEILLQVVLCIETKGSKESLSQMSEHELGEKIYKSLSGRRYLIIMDDIWSIEAWDEMKFFFPNNNNGSRLIITTRLSNLALQLTDSYGLKMNFLDEDKSWNLLCKTVFREESCPLELEEIGKKISKNCKGLPLSIVVIGGFLAKSQKTREYWEYIAENLISIVNLDDNERCLKILHMSYNRLPIHLKPCFLYMGVFPEDNEIRVSMLIKLWVAEGFLKPICGKSLEMVAQEYFKDLVDRNLILVRKLGRTGKIKFCTIHDLLWDLCLREAEKEKFLCATRMHDISQGINTQRRICIHRSTKAQALDALQSASLARSLLGEINGVLPQFDFRLLRVWNVVDDYILDFYENLLNTYPREAIFQLVNLRFLDIELTSDQVQVTPLPSSIHLLWNLWTLIVKVYLAPKEITGALPETLGVTAPSEIWKMPQLKHVEFYELHLPEPPSGEMDGRDDSLGNLQTLLTIRNFKCGEEVLKRIPNIKKLEIHYEGFEEWSSCCLNNVGRLRKLKTLGCFFSSEMRPSRSYLVQNLIFPHSLRKLSLGGSHLNWDDMKTKIGSLPLLEVLILYEASFIGPKWETVDGQFCSLKFLLIEKCYDLKYWTVDSTHFPRLEQLCLYKLRKLKEIPLGIGDISTLQSIELGKCSESSVISAKEILKEQEDLGNVGLQVRVILKQWNDAIQSLASHNFQVEVLKS